MINSLQDNDNKMNKLSKFKIKFTFFKAILENFKNELNKKIE